MLGYLSRYLKHTLNKQVLLDFYGKHNMLNILKLVPINIHVHVYAPERNARRTLCKRKAQPQQTLVVKTGSDSSTAKRSAFDASVTGPGR